MYKKHSHKIHIHLLAEFWPQNFLPRIRSELYHKNLGFVHKRISDPTLVGLTISLWEVQNSREKKSLLSQPGGELPTSFFSVPGPHPNQKRPTLTQKIGQVPRRARGGPTRWASLGRIRLSAKEREKETEREQTPGKTNILLYSCLILEEAPLPKNPTKEFGAMVKMMGFWYQPNWIETLFLTLCVTLDKILKAVSHLASLFLKLTPSLVSSLSVNRAMLVLSPFHTTWCELLFCFVF